MSRSGYSDIHRDGITDDTAAIQASLDRGKAIRAHDLAPYESASGCEIVDQLRTIESASALQRQANELTACLRELEIIDELTGRSGAESVRSSSMAVREVIQRQAEELVEVRKTYQELIYAVARKFPDESRHQTALRYINNAERQDNPPAAAISKGNPDRIPIGPDDI